MPEKEKPILVPELTPELLAENEQMQSKWRRKYSVPQNNADAYLRSLIKADLEILDALELQRKTSGDKKSVDEKIKHYRDETADAYMSLGDFSLAATLSADKQKRKLYRSYDKAVEKTDGDWCDHPRWTRSENNQTQQVAYREFDFFSVKHGRVISMMRCSVCGFRNAELLPRDLEQLSAHRQNIVNRTAGMSRHEAARVTKEIAEEDISRIFK